MTDIVHTAADYTGCLQNSMPTGPVWPSDPGTVQSQVLGGFAPLYAQLETDSQALLVDAFPATAVNLLPEWQSSLGLPDPCAGPAPSIAQSQAQVVARFANTGGQSPSFFTQYAAALGFTITINQFEPWRCGVSRCGQPLNGVAYAYAWQVVAPEDTPAYGQAVLECELNTLRPAHTAVFYSYIG